MVAIGRLSLCFESHALYTLLGIAPMFWVTPQSGRFGDLVCSGAFLILCLLSLLTGCKFSRGHTLLSLALVEVQNKGRVGCRQKNVWKAGVAITTKCA